MRPVIPHIVEIIPDCTGIILAGGHSSRFGQPKADVVWRGGSLISHVAGHLRYVAREVVAVARAEQDSSQWPVDRVIHDDPCLPAGPLRGVVAGLNSVQTPYAFVCSCDSPAINSRLYVALRQRVTPHEFAVVPVWEGYLQPLVALYAVRAAPVLSLLLEQGELSPTRVLSRLSHQTLSEEECRHIDPTGLSFCNVNSAEDMVRLSVHKAVGFGESDPTGR